MQRSTRNDPAADNASHSRVTAVARTAPEWNVAVFMRQLVVDFTCRGEGG